MTAAPQLTAEQLSTLPDPAADLLAFVQGAAAYGDAVGFEMGGVSRTLITDPDAAFEFLRQAPDAARDIPISAATAVVAGDGLLLTSGVNWQPRRLVIQKELSHRHVRDHTRLFLSNIESAFREWAAAGQVDLQQRVGALTLENLGDTVFATDFRPVRELLRGITELLLQTAEGANSGRTDDAVDTRLRGLVGQLDELIQVQVDERRQRSEPGHDILSVLTQAAAAGTAVFNDRWVRDEAVTLIIAGHDTTAFLTTMALVNLARHHHVRDQLREELQAAVDRGVDREQLVDEVPLVRLVLEETLRLYPPVAILHRLVTAPTAIAGVDVQPGSLLVFSPWVQHHDGRHFSEPQLFDPQRFQRDRRAEFGHSYIPFGVGRRICAGNHFAMLEAAMIVAIATLDYGIDLVDQDEPRIVSTVSLHVADGVPVQITRVERQLP